MIKAALNWKGMQLHLTVQNNCELKLIKSHFALEVDDLESMKQKLQESGYEVSSAQKVPNFERFNTWDPFGNRIEFMSKSIQTVEIS